MILKDNYFNARNASIKSENIKSWNLEFLCGPSLWCSISVQISSVSTAAQLIEVGNKHVFKNTLYLQIFHDVFKIARHLEQKPGTCVCLTPHWIQIPIKRYFIQSPHVIPLICVCVFTTKLNANASLQEIIHTVPTCHPPPLGVCVLTWLFYKITFTMPLTFFFSKNPLSFV